jgi:hypothetical protein
MILTREVSFLCVGAQKSGTTTLRRLLRQHPQIRMPAQEVHFFDNDTFDWGAPNYSLYHSIFEMELASNSDYKKSSENIVSEGICFGEVTPIYMYWQPCPLRIFKYNPEMKLIFLLRNPISRAFSQWSMEFNRGSESADFTYSIHNENERLQECAYQQHRVYSYIKRGMYSAQIDHFLTLFKQEQMLFIKAESFFANPLTELNKICEFLGIKPFDQVNALHEHKGDYKNTINAKDWHYLYSRLGCDILKLEKLLNWQLEDWKAPSLPILN